LIRVGVAYRCTAAFSGFCLLALSYDLDYNSAKSNRKDGEKKERKKEITEKLVLGVASGKFDKITRNFACAYGYEMVVLLL
jgi:hypothetical protein